MLANTLVIVFVLVYGAIALEHPLRVNKSASALLGAGLLWTIYAAAGGGEAHHAADALAESLIATAQIVFFLMGAMAIVEVVDAHHGFEVVTARIRTTSLPVLTAIVSVVTFTLSAVLDNLTTAIVMVSLLRKLVRDDEDRLLLAGMVVIAANAGGAWSPIGDVTTTMLWIGGQITPAATVKSLLLPSLACLAVPLAVLAVLLRGRRLEMPQGEPGAAPVSTPLERNLMFWLGLAVLVAVPVFKTSTGLPPFMGILLGLGLLWIVGDLMHRHKPDEARQRLTLAHALHRIDLSSIMFFIGILLAVATLEHAGVLKRLAAILSETIGREDLIVLIIGAASAIVDNVPLVAACMGMYSLDTHPPDAFLWQFLAYCAGTGGSILIIGSAAGVAAMGLENIRFGWYLKYISGLALLGYLAGAGVYLLQSSAGA